MAAWQHHLGKPLTMATACVVCSHGGLELGSVQTRYIPGARRGKGLMLQKLG
jgi:hypothetical protein